MFLGSSNVLNEYHSYTVHYRLYATSSLKNAEMLLKNLNEEDIFNNPKARTLDEYDNYTRAKISTKLKSGDAFEYYDVIDSRRDSDYFITKYTFKTYIEDVPSTKMLSYGSNLDCMVTIHEAYSGHFLKFVNTVAQEEHSQQLYFVIKPFFVCVKHLNNVPTTDKSPQYVTIHKDSGNIIILTGITADYGVNGSDYHLEGLTEFDGISKMPSTTVDYTSQLSLAVKPNSSIQEVIQQFEDLLNTESTKLYTQNTSTTKYITNKYKLLLDEDYTKTKDYMFDNAAQNNTKSRQNNPVLSFKDCTIVDAIMHIMVGSTRVLDDAATIDPKNKQTVDQVESTDADTKKTKANEFYKKYQPYISSTVASHPDDANVSIHTYTIHKKLFISTNEGTSGFSADNESIQNFEKQFFNGDKHHNVMVYNYLYTGKNVDVTDFKLGLLNGILVPLVTDNDGLVPQSAITVDEHNNNLSKQVVNASDPPTQLQPQTLTAIKVPSKTGISNNKNETKYLKFYDVLNRITFVESLKFKITVVGNPKIIGTVSTDKINENTIFSKNKLPCLFFLNVHYPVSSNFWSFNTNGTSPKLAPFWYRGLMRIILIDTTFDGNNFYHEIEALPLISESQQAQQSVDYYKNQAATSINNESAAQGAVQKIVTSDFNLQRDVIDNVSSKNANGDIKPITEVPSKLHNNANARNIRLPAPVASFKVMPGTPLPKAHIASSYAVYRVRTKKNSKGEDVDDSGYHYGTDLSSSPGAAVKAPFDGTIRAINGKYWRIEITNDKGITIRYMHVNPIKALQTTPATLINVTAGQVIGNIVLAGTGAHLHFELLYLGKLYNGQQVLNNPTFKSAFDVIKIDF